MSELDDRAIAHAAHLERLCADGGPLTAESPHATTSNPAWFTQVDGRFEPTPERLLLHKRLLAEAEARFPHVRRDRLAIVLAGPPGAGKSSAQSTLIAATGRPAEHFRVVNADDFKDDLLDQAMKDGSYERHLMPPEVTRAQAAGERFYPRELASLVHEESSMLAKTAITTSIRRGDNLVVDGTLASKTSADRLFRQLDRRRYTVVVASVETSRHETERRIAGRWRGGYTRAEAGIPKTPREGVMGGRWVPGGLTDSMYRDGPRQSVCRDVATWAKGRFRSIVKLERYRVNPATGQPQLEGRPAMAVPAGKQGRSPDRTAAARATGRRPRPARVAPGAVPKMVAVPKVVVRRSKAAKAQAPPTPRPRPVRDHGR